MKDLESEGRPAGNGPASKSLDDSNTSVNATTDFLTALADCTGPDDPLFKAASLLSQAWQPAMDTSYRLGYANGYNAGFYEAERDMADAWAAAAAPVRAVLRQPTHAELARRRGEATG